MLPIGVIFDLDDTLYLERDFARSGFIAAGDWLRREAGSVWTGQICQEDVRGRPSDRASSTKRSKLSGSAPIRRLSSLLVEIYRTHEPTIALAADAARYLCFPAGRFLAGLMTDGPSGTQQAKVRALELESALDFIVYTDALGRGYGKPHPRAFELVEAWAAPYGLPLAYVADNPLKDFVTPRARGWWTVQMERPERVHHVAAPDAAHEAARSDREPGRARRLSRPSAIRQRTLFARTTMGALVALAASP